MNSQEWRDKDTLRFKFDLKVYNEIARDTLKAIINKQRHQKLKTGESEYYLYEKTKPDNVQFITIPIFRIERYAYNSYNGENQFESFILFEERTKYQRLIITSKDQPIGLLSIPDYKYEIDRHYPGDEMVGDEKNYYANRLKFRVDHRNSDLENVILTKPKNFYFQIFGLENYLLDIDSEDNKIYMQYIGQCGCLLYGITKEKDDENQKSLKTRLPVNDYIIKNLSLQTIQSIAVGFYSDEFDFPQLDVKSFESDIRAPKAKIVLKIEPAANRR